MDYPVLVGDNANPEDAWTELGERLLSHIGPSMKGSFALPGWRGMDILTRKWTHGSTWAELTRQVTGLKLVDQWLVTNLSVLLIDPLLRNLAEYPENFRLPGWTIEYTHNQSGATIRFTPPNYKGRRIS